MFLRFDVVGLELNMIVKRLWVNIIAFLISILMGYRPIKYNRKYE